MADPQTETDSGAESGTDTSTDTGADTDSGRSSKRAPARSRSASTRTRTPRKTTAPKAAARKRPSQRDEPAEASERNQDRPDDGPAAAGNGAQLALSAAQQLVTLTGKPFEGIVGLARKEHGWDVEVEVLEMRRIPNTTDVISVYRVGVSPDGDLVSYRRLHRYLRGQAGDDR